MDQLAVVILSVIVLGVGNNRRFWWRAVINGRGLIPLAETVMVGHRGTRTGLREGRTRYGRAVCVQHVARVHDLAVAVKTGLSLMVLKRAAIKAGNAVTVPVYVAINNRAAQVRTAGENERVIACPHFISVFHWRGDDNIVDDGRVLDLRHHSIGRAGISNLRVCRDTTQIPARAFAAFAAGVDDGVTFNDSVMCGHHLDAAVHGIAHNVVAHGCIKCAHKTRVVIIIEFGVGLVPKRDTCTGVGHICRTQAGVLNEVIFNERVLRAAFHISATCRCVVNMVAADDNIVTIDHVDALGIVGRIIVSRTCAPGAKNLVIQDFHIVAVWRDLDHVTTGIMQPAILNGNVAGRLAGVAERAVIILKRGIKFDHILTTTRHIEIADGATVCVHIEGENRMRAICPVWCHDLRCSVTRIARNGDIRRIELKPTGNFVNSAPDINSITGLRSIQCGLDIGEIAGSILRHYILCHFSLYFIT